MLLELWSLIDADLHDVYGVDTATGILRRRPASWLINRIVGLLTSPDTRIARAIANQAEGGT